MTNMPKFKFTFLQWVDATSSSDWETNKEVADWMLEDKLITDLGWVIAENDEYVVISNQFADDGDWGNKTKIPKGWIRVRKDATLGIEDATTE